MTVYVAVVAELRWWSLERERGGRGGEECLADGARVVASHVLFVFDILGVALILRLIAAELGLDHLQVANVAERVAPGASLDCSFAFEIGAVVGDVDKIRIILLVKTD